MAEIIKNKSYHAIIEFWLRISGKSLERRPLNVVSNGLEGLPLQGLVKIAADRGSLSAYVSEFYWSFNGSSDQFACERDKRHVKLFLTEANQLDICTRESKQTWKGFYISAFLIKQAKEFVYLVS